MNITNGILEQATFIASPNYDQREKGHIDLVVVHCISLPAGEYENDHVRQLFCNSLDCESHPDFDSLHGLKVSSHLFIRREGEVVQFVPFHERAWHAGKSEHRGRSDCNEFSIGIELEGTDQTAFTDVQYLVLRDVLSTLKTVYPIDDVVGHQDIAPGRKTDPGTGFDWARLEESE